MKKIILSVICSIFALQLMVPGAVFAGGTDQTTSVSFVNPLAYDTVEDLLGNILNELQGIIVILSLIFMIIGAIFYITSAGNESQMKLAKGAIAAALIGLAIGIAAPSFLRQISDILGWTGASSVAGVGTALTLSQIALNVLNFLLGIVGTLALIMLIIGAIMYFGSSADEKNVEKGKTIVKWAIVGIIVALASLTIVKQIASIIAG